MPALDNTALNVGASDKHTPLHGVNGRASTVRFSLMFVLSQRLFRQTLVLRAGAIHNITPEVTRITGFVGIGFAG